ncbi:Piso0_003055 [Millerozyma farinosa CBS 7064]|uniref:Piso0_003055 protein n=1 Tax=Pichia sorbitophila (strain ATCC MYA-4447 / BCRC 22081 / CBS 7064 / NBRC 10061 / NRRL Y-12695) TaxID=559304 RepID=G8YH25_PICSO|nr:Piso0_003055 [Millerozyma farinosa CBS 7064]CCE80727.1 Piso0_003055 [Millerozyma farinosa CBS 7064]
MCIRFRNRCASLASNFSLRCYLVAPSHTATESSHRLTAGLQRRESTLNKESPRTHHITELEASKAVTIVDPDALANAISHASPALQAPDVRLVCFPIKIRVERHRVLEPHPPPQSALEPPCC